MKLAVQGAGAPQGHVIVLAGASFCADPDGALYWPEQGLLAVADLLSRIRGRIVHKALDHVSPLAVPALLEIGREQVYGEASDALLAEAEAELVKEAMR